jgi:DNA-directed RNA polymerase specialized sigma24 family protein
MEQLVGLDASILRHIRGIARLLSRRGSVPGMDHDDIEQDLILDLWRRRRGFDPSRASFRTFADRIVAHRVATLTSSTARFQAERKMVWLDRPTGEDESSTLADSLRDSTAPTDIDLGLVLDVTRFVAALTPGLRRCCAILMEPNISEAAPIAGQHHSAVYDGVARLRLLASAVGLHDYLVPPRQIGPPAGK